MSALKREIGGGEEAQSAKDALLSAPGGPVMGADALGHNAAAPVRDGSVEAVGGAAHALHTLVASPSAPGGSAVVGADALIVAPPCESATERAPIKHVKWHICCIVLCTVLLPATLQV